MTILGRVAASMLCAALCTVGTAQEHGKPAGEKPAAGAPAKAPMFVVAKSGEKMEVMAKEAFDAKNKQLADDYAKAMQQYEKDKSAAEAAHKKFEGKMPTRSELVAMGGDFPTKEAAEAAMKKMAEKAKPEDKGKGKPEDKGKGGAAPGKNPHR